MRLPRVGRRVRDHRHRPHRRLRADGQLVHPGDARGSQLTTRHARQTHRNRKTEEEDGTEDWLNRALLGQAFLQVGRRRARRSGARARPRRLRRRRPEAGPHDTAAADDRAAAGAARGRRRPRRRRPAGRDLDVVVGRAGGDRHPEVGRSRRSPSSRADRGRQSTRCSWTRRARDPAVHGTPPRPVSRRTSSSSSTASTTWRTSGSVTSSH